MDISINAIDTLTVAGLLLGISLGVGISYWLNNSKKSDDLGLTPNDLSQWLIPEHWSDFASRRNHIDLAKEELSKLSSQKKDGEKEALKIEEKINLQLERVNKLKKEIENAETKVAQQAKTLTFSTIMTEIGVLRDETDTHNDLLSPHGRKTRFLKSIINGDDQRRVEDVMNTAVTGRIIENPFGETFKMIDAQWDGLNEIPGLQDKIIHEMLSIPKSES